MFNLNYLAIPVFLIAFLVLIQALKQISYLNRLYKLKQELEIEYRQVIFEEYCKLISGEIDTIEFYNKSEELGQLYLFLFEDFKRRKNQKERQ